MKNLTLIKIETNNKKAKFTYQVIEEGKKIAERKSNREYIACYVSQYEEATKEKFHWDNTQYPPKMVIDIPSKKTGKILYDTPFFFGRMELIGKGDSGRRGDSFYGLAVLNAEIRRQALKIAIFKAKELSHKTVIGEDQKTGEFRIFEVESTLHQEPLFKLLIDNNCIGVVTCNGKKLGNELNYIDM